MHDASTPGAGSREVVRALGRAGFVLDRVTGSHQILYDPAKPHLRVTVPHHSRDLKPKTLRSIVSAGRPQRG